MAIKLFSKLNQAVSVSYGKTTIIIPAYAMGLVVTNEKKLGNLPEGIKVVPLNSKEGK